MTTSNSVTSPRRARLAARAPEVPAGGLDPRLDPVRRGAPRRSLDRAGRAREQLLERVGGCGCYRRPQRRLAADRGGASPAVDARPRPAARPRARRADAPCSGPADRRRPLDRLLLVRARRRARRVRRRCRARRALRDERRRHVHLPRHPADRAPVRRADEDRRAGDHLPRDRRPRPAGAAAGDAGRQRAAHGALARGRQPSVRGVGDRPLVPDGCEPGGDPARLEREHPGLPLGREGVGEARRVLRPGRLRGDRAHPFDRPRAPRQRGRQPRQPAVRRSRPRDPDRQPHGCREEGEPRLPGVLRERLQRRPDARPLLLGGDPRAVRVVQGAAPGRPSARVTGAGSTRCCGRRCASSSAT